jgi:two-component system alkaline phosphatase synthesis response regulator PhoP
VCDPDVPKSDPDASQKSPTVVMIADADFHVRELAGHFLTEAGYQVEYAVDGYEALDNARKTLPAVILVDIIIPKLDGLALCRLLKRDPATQNISVIVFSVLSAPERAQNAGADAFLSKPLEKTILVDALTAVIMRSALL